MILSVIVPAHNVESFIERCLVSLVNADREDNVEIIVVDDGSTDATGDIVERFAYGRESVKVLRQENQGLGAARNAGIRVARGDYIWFVDGDDWLKPNALDRVLHKLNQIAPDVLVVDFSCADESGQPIQWIHSPFARDAGKDMRGPQFFALHHATTYAWLYVIKRSLLDEHDLRFQPRINMQDAELLPHVFAVARQVYVSGIDAYVYVKRAGSFINSAARAVRERYFQSVLEVRRRLQDFQGTLSDPVMSKALEEKLSSLRRILLMAYVYDVLDNQALRLRYGDLRKAGAYPFARLSEETPKEWFIRLAVNLAPVSFPRGYRWLRERTAGIRGLICDSFGVRA